MPLLRNQNIMDGQTGGRTDRLRESSIPSGHFLPVQWGRNISAHSQRQISSIFPDFIIFFQKKLRKNCHKKTKTSVDLNISIDQAVSVTTCSCKQLDYTGYRYVYWWYPICIEQSGAKNDVQADKNTIFSKPSFTLVR